MRPARLALDERKLAPPLYPSWRRLGSGKVLRQAALMRPEGVRFPDLAAPLEEDPRRQGLAGAIQPEIDLAGLARH
ncbi:hypothetical protein D3C78_1708930 [compost metagenome]